MNIRNTLNQTQEMTMKKATTALAIASLALWSTLAVAEDDHQHDGAEGAAECQAGIDFIKAEIGKGPAAEVLTSLERKLRIAETELEEQEWDECHEAIDAAKTLVSGG